MFWALRLTVAPPPDALAPAEALADAPADAEALAPADALADAEAPADPLAEAAALEVGGGGANVQPGELVPTHAPSPSSSNAEIATGRTREMSKDGITTSQERVRMPGSGTADEASRNRAAETLPADG